MGGCSSKAHKIHPEHVGPLHDLSSLAWFQKEGCELAGALLQEALEIDPEQLSALLKLAAVVTDHKKDFGEAEAPWHREALEIPPEHFAPLAQDHKRDFGGTGARQHAAMETETEHLAAMETETEHLRTLLKLVPLVPHFPPKRHFEAGTAPRVPAVGALRRKVLGALRRGRARSAAREAS